MKKLKLVQLAAALIAAAALGACNGNGTGLFATEKSQSAAPAGPDRTDLAKDQERAAQSTTSARATQTEPEQSVEKTIELVRKVQQKLNHLERAGLAVDGILGRHTKSALRDFQESRKLPASGELNRETLAALGVTNSQVSASR